MPTVKKEEVKTAKPKAVKVAKAPVETKATAPKVEKKSGGLSVPVYSLTGKTVATSFTLPEELFGGEVNLALLSQAIRVYTNNQKAHFGNTKTRGEMSYSTKKIYKQKGTGGARHGSKSAPIFVHTGGVALGPKYRKIALDLPKKMKDQALLSSLSQKAKTDQILAVEGLEKASGKTKEMAAFVKGINKKTVLLVTGVNSPMAVRSARNISNITTISASLVNAYEVVKHQSLVLTKDAVEELQKRLVKGAK
jgi:large subunit ribosomal protein L4